MKHRFGNLVAPQHAHPELEWRRLAEILPIFDRSLRTLELWCVNGTFHDFGYEVYLHHGVWWVAMRATNAVNE